MQCSFCVNFGGLNYFSALVELLFAKVCGQSPADDGRYLRPVDIVGVLFTRCMIWSVGTGDGVTTGMWRRLGYKVDLDAGLQFTCGNPM